MFLQERAQEEREGALKEADTPSAAVKPPGGVTVEPVVEATGAAADAVRSAGPLKGAVLAKPVSLTSSNWVREST